MSSSLFNSFKLGHKIFAGFASVGLIAVVIGMLSYFAFQAIALNFNSFIDTSSRARLDLSLSRNLSEMQRNALIYTHEGHSSAAEKVRELYAGMVERIKLASALQEPDVERIKNHLGSYIKAFEQLQVQRKMWQQLVYQDFRESASRSENYLRTRMLDTSVTRSDRDRLLAERTLNTLLLIEKNAMRYFDTLDPDYIRQAKLNFAEVDRQLGVMKQQVTTRTKHEEIDRAIEEVRDYERIFLEAVQRTRGYLFLVNVVMSGEASEILYHANQMALRAKHNLVSIEVETFDTLHQMSSTILVSIAILLVLGLALSVLIGRMISRPVIRLTEAFKALAAGSSEAKIPDYKAGDEIGELTRAASVFKEKNLQTEALLKQSKKLSHALKTKSDELEIKNRELNDFASVASHDLQEPLRKIQAFSDRLTSKYAEALDERGLDYLQRMNAAAFRMSDLIQSLLQLSRVSSRAGAFEKVSLKILVDDALSVLDEAIAEHQARVVVDELPEVEVDPMQIKQLFQNLIGNALKFHHEGTSPEIRVYAIGSKESHIEVCVSDNGIGVDSEFAHKVFEPFERLHGREQFAGTGMGLAICKRIVERHNGSIRVEPGEDSMGSRFVITLPKQQEGGE